MSEPVASVAVPAASAAADPPLDPPGEYCVFHGLRVTPQSLDQVTGAQQNSGVVVLACTMPPASMIRCTNAAVLSATSSRSGSEPSVLRWPAIGGLLLDRDRQAFQRPRRRPPLPAYRASAARAAPAPRRSGCSANALMTGSTASARSITAVISSTGDSSRARNCAVPRWRAGSAGRSCGLRVPPPAAGQRPGASVSSLAAARWRAAAGCRGPAGRRAPARWGRAPPPARGAARSPRR